MLHSATCHADFSTLTCRYLLLKPGPTGHTAGGHAACPHEKRKILMIYHNVMMILINYNLIMIMMRKQQAREWRRESIKANSEEANINTPFSQTPSGWPLAAPSSSFLPRPCCRPSRRRPLRRLPPPPPLLAPHHPPSPRPPRPRPPLPKELSPEPTPPRETDWPRAQARPPLPPFLQTPHSQRPLQQVPSPGLPRNGRLESGRELALLGDGRPPRAGEGRLSPG